jgi:hypothetical protein
MTCRFSRCEGPAERAYFGAPEGSGAGLLLHGFAAGAPLAATLGVAAWVGAAGGLLLQGFTFAAVLAATLGAAAWVGAAGGSLLQGFTFAAVLVAGLGAVASVGAAGGPLFHGLGFPVTVAEGGASGAFLSWLQPPSKRTIAMASDNRFNVCYSQSLACPVEPSTELAQA